MFEAHVLHLLRRYLGEYVHGLSAEALRISVWKGDVVLKDLKLKAEALNSLKLPLTVKAGFVGTITLKVPWKSLGKEPVIVLIDRVFILAHPQADSRSLKEDDREKLFQAKLQQIEEAESATLEAISRSKLGSSQPGNSWLGSLIATIIGNLKISISNVHVRYEDGISNPGHPFSCGITLAKLAAVTMDEQGNETFDTSGALDKLRKSVQLERLAMYHDSNRNPWKLDKRWEDLSPKEWVEIFEDGINEFAKENMPMWSRDRNFLVSPINGVLKYHRLGNQERNDPNIPFEKASVVVTDVSLAITEAQYHDWIRLMEVISRYKAYVEISHLRPAVPVSDNAAVWWRYATQAALQQKKMCYRLSWGQIKYLCNLRRRYIQLYAGALQQSLNVDNYEIRGIEKDLDPKVILLWRLLAHAKVESVKSKEAAEQKMLRKRSWLPFGWGAASDEVSAGSASEGSLVVEERLTKEEWQAINKLLSYQSDEDLTLHPGKEMQNMVRYLVDVSISRAAARIININHTEIACGTFENLHVSAKLKHRSTHCDVTLKFYGLSAPEGSLAQSVCSEQKVNALSASFVHSPTGENLDWRLSATISPCHVTVFMESYNRFLDFLKRSNAISPTVAMETATALQHKIEKVTRRAQEQFQMVLEEQSRFALDIDLDAPKVRVPIRTAASSKCDSHLLLDFGHFTLHTKDDDLSHDQGRSLYSRFLISGRDIAAFFSDCGSDIQKCSLAHQPSISSSLQDGDSFYSLIDRCGMAIIIDQIKVPHPSHPSTRVSIQMPTLGIHLSPSRYCRLMELLNIFYGAMQTSEQLALESSETNIVPWNPPDLATEARMLVWRGIGYSVAAWQPCFIVLSGFHLYVLESEASHSYQRCTSMSGKQVLEVPSTSVGGSLSCVAVCVRGVDAQKALESFSSVIIEFQDEGEKAVWMRGLVQATYQASAPPSVDLPGELSNDASEFTESHATHVKSFDLVVNGALVEMKLSLYGKCGDVLSGTVEESLILEVLAGGGKVYVSRCEADLDLKMKLHSLKIKDELQGSLSSSPQYLACSFVSDQGSVPNINILESHGKEVLIMEDDDSFIDALPDFTLLPDSSEVVNDEKDQLKAKAAAGDVFYEVEGSDDSDFVSVVYVTRNLASPDYDGIDTQMSIRMSKLEFYCNRPTLVALISFGLDLSSAGSSPYSSKSTKVSDDEYSMKKDKTEQYENSFVKGLLGYGKGRVVFYLNMNVDSVAVFLNKEDGSQLAMFVQESFLLDVKVHPSSTTIEGTLGNLRLRDLSLGSSNCWGWLCDIRNQGTESLVQFKFSSYSTSDDDYDGYDYSLHGRLSAVRIVFLYRFVQEITAYFMELASPHTEEVIKLVDKVGGIEWLIQKYEIDGASAIKLDLLLDTPLIIVPRNSLSKDFMQLDLGHLRIKNEFSWHGYPEKDPSAVHLDILDAEILGINMAIGVDGSIGKLMIQEGRDMHVYVRRSLRDIFRKVPTFALEVKIGSLHAVMSHREYNVILDCFFMNLNEQPSLPPSFRGHTSASKDTIKLLADKVNLNGQVLLSRTVTIIAVEVDYALLEVYHGVLEELPLAHVAVEGLWVSYRMTSLSEADLYVTISKFSIIDNRPGTKPEMRLMLGSCTDIMKQMPSESMIDAPTTTMFVMDCRWRLSSQSFVVRIQQPRILVVLDFILAICEFFVPSLGTLTGREEMMDPKNDPVVKSKSIILLTPLYKQIEDVVNLSPNRQLVADAVGISEYIYDGCGKTINLSYENMSKEFHSSGDQPIIIIGNGKTLRFTNVKIENGSLLSEHAYLGNGSSYTVFHEDGVEIIFLENSSPDDGREHSDHMEEFSYTAVASDSVQTESYKLQSFSFETQIVSPELTFYDGSKSSLDDSTHGEKLLRAKMDFSFMYASKESDTWIRGLLKDLSLEAGSGLIMLDPVDISGGYTSVKDKINLSLMSTDICVHLSLSVLSLLLNLQCQSAEALQFGNADPLSPCTNFDRVWVSPKEIGRHNNLTFWRPQAPSNYVILGDCVTSRPSPPSQTVMAVNSTYGRVRKPVGFKLMGTFSGIQGSEGLQENSNMDCDCSLWLPIAPPGYLALGCVAHGGSQPPPNHIVHCLRSDLATSTMYSECIFSAVSSVSYVSGFSIWRLDNAFGSFYAHPSTDCPPNDECFDRNHLLRWFPGHKSSSSNQSATDLTAVHDCKNELTSSTSATSSGWDTLRSISKTTSCHMSTPHFKRIWWDRGSDLRRPVSIWRPIPRPGYAVLGDCITEGLEPPPLGIIFKADDPEMSSKPVQFTRVAHIGMKGLDEAFFWYPIAPPGYASLGCVVTQYDAAPSLESFCCPRLNFVSQTNIIEMPITKYSSSKASQCWSIWKVENQACTFLARSDLKKPSPRLAFAIRDFVKPKSKENITAEMKIRYFSLTILDSLCGMMTPLFDATITNLKLATHGQSEAMNAVLISSIAASTFNTQLEAWEPVVEPFEGIFKFETYDTNLNVPSRVAKRIRIAATSILNVNLSSSNLETLVQTITSWRKQRELEEKAVRRIEEASHLDGHGDDATLSALDEDDFQTVIVENKLGCDVFIKRIEENFEQIELLKHDSSASVWLPPPRYSDRLNVADESREPRRYVAVQIVEAKGLPVVDDGNSHNFFCALRLVVDNQEINQQKLFPQSARTKCVKPLIVQSNDVIEGIAKWNELFIFEVPRKGSAKLEMEVTNLAAKAGKGEVVGASSFSVGRGASSLKKVSSVKMLHHAYDVQNVSSYPLRRKGLDTEIIHYEGSILVFASYYEGKIVTNFENDLDGRSDTDRDVGFWLGLARDGPWECFRSYLPVSVITRTLKDDLMAVDVVMKNGKKHGVLRGLVTVTNDLDIKLDISLCLISMAQTQDLVERSKSVVVEEVFQNQRYHPTFGWGNHGPRFDDNDPRSWSSRDFSYSSDNFFEPHIPPGSTWASAWSVDKSSFVDADGWAYGPDYDSLRWPPNSAKSNTKSNVDTVRRRRWTRTRNQVNDHIAAVSDVFSATIPGSATILPWRSVSKDFDYCLQVRPGIDDSRTPCEWGHPVTEGVAYAWGKDQTIVDQAALARQNTMKQAKKSISPLRLNELEKKDVLFCCPSTGGKNFWLSVGTDASVLQTGLNTPVYDWNISVSSPLKLENRLPCAADFVIWEKVKDGNNIEQLRGFIPSRGTKHIYCADLRNPIYLTMTVHGDWIMEKEAVLILDLASNNHASSFWMVHRQRKRRLRVSIERDVGGTTASPKTIRFFVPYWISNDSSLSLAYRVMEIEPLENTDVDSAALSKVKSAKLTMKTTPGSLLGRQISSRKNVQVLEAIEDTSPIPSMLSPQDYVGRGGVMLFSSRNDTYLSPRVGIAVACHSSENFSAGISLLELEKKQRVDLKAFGSDGSYYKLSALLNMTSDRTKVVHFQPHTLFTNRVGCSICLQQCDTQAIEWIHPSDPPKHFSWQSAKVELLKLRLDGHGWSAPFSVDTEGMMSILLKSDTRIDQTNVRVEVRSGTKSCRYEVIFRPNFFSSPYRIENRSLFLPIRFRQADGPSDSWQSLLPNSSTFFSWEDLGRQKILEVSVDGPDSVTSQKYNIDEIFDNGPFNVQGGNMNALRVTILKEEKTNVVKISDWKPDSDPSTILSRIPPSMINVSGKNLLPLQTSSNSECEFHLVVEVLELGLSIIDHTPEEILYLSMQSLFLSHSTGLGSGISRLKIRMRGIQVDNQLPLTPTPVLFRPQRVGEENDYILKFSVTQQSDGSLDAHVYPYIGFRGPENSAFLINIHEPIIWRIHGMIQQANLNRLYYAQSTSVSMDPIIQIGVLNFSEVRFKVSMAMSPSQRPVGVLGFWSSLMTALGNTENMPVRINERYLENVSMRQSVLVANAISNVKKDLLSQPLQLLSGVDILGNASSALGHMSKGVAALSMDKKFIQSRQRKESKGVEDFGDVLREGGGALAKGLFRGVTGILTKPLEGAKASGVEGFVQGVGKGLIGAAAQPVSGVLDLLSKTTEGANAVRMKIASAIASEDQLLRRRLPRAISGDNLLRPYDEYKSEGQAMLQLAESGTFFSQVNLFKVRAKFALTDAYEDHFLLPKARIVVISHRRVILLLQPSNIIAQKKFNPARDPCSVSWDVVWDDLVTIELTHGKKDNPSSPPSRLVLYLQSRSMEAKDQVRVIKCHKDSNQAMEIYSSIEQVRSTYGPRPLQASQKRKVTKPYSPSAEMASEAFSNEGVSASPPQQLSGSVPLSSTFGSSGDE